MANKRPPTTPLKSPVSKKLFTSPNRSPSRPKLTFLGYVVHIGQVKDAYKGGQYFIMQFQTASNSKIEIKVMVYKTELEQFKAFGKEDAVYLENISHPDDLTYFFNSRYGSVATRKEFRPPFFPISFVTNINEIKHCPELFNVKGVVTYLTGVKETNNGNKFIDAVIQDQTGDIPFTIWERFMQLIEDGQAYHVTNLETKMYDGVKLSTTPKDTNVEKIKLQVQKAKLDDLKKKYGEEEPSTALAHVCCPTVITTGMETLKFCPIKTCRTPAPSDPGLLTHECTGCKKTINLTMIPSIFSGTIDFQEADTDDLSTLEFDFAPLAEFFQIDSSDQFNMYAKKLVLQTDLDISYDPLTRKVVSFTRHSEKKSNSEKSETKSKEAEKDSEKDQNNAEKGDKPDPSDVVV